MKLIFSFFKFKAIKKVFSPTYTYTLDMKIGNSGEAGWVFKEFGTHTYVKKTWVQLLDGDFLREVNPKDIAIIAEAEARKKVTGNRLSIIEENRNGVWTLENRDRKITVTGKEFLKDKELISNINTVDATRIAYYTGLRKGREISETLMRSKLPESKIKQKLRLVK
jgi:hypothetical protein